MFYAFRLSPVLNRFCFASLPGKYVFFLSVVPLLGVLPTRAQVSALESVQVRPGSAVRLRMPLEAGELYLLKASGTVQAGAYQVDAGSSAFGTAKLNQVGQAGADSEDGVVVTGIGADAAASSQSTPLPPVPDRRRWVNGSRSTHIYYMIVSGAGKMPSFRLLTPHAQTGKGAITLSVFRLSPVPALLPPPLETVQVPVLEQRVATTLTTRPGVLYLLQASGSGRVGGGGLGQGDAEYMDYKADGTGAEDVGDANTDYGLGVDEADQSVSPRRYKWGAWRKDHTYYLLFAGTGQPIHFFFYDVKGGYGDNSPIDALTVKVFPVP